jgi:hypothetical protein
VASGKTTVAIEIGELLEQRAEPYAVVDLDWLAWVRPSLDAGMTVQGLMLTNLAAVWRTYRDAGVRRLVLTRELESLDQLDGIREAIPAVEVTTVRLVAAERVLVQRLRRRDSGAQLAEHLERTGRVAADPEAAALAQATVDSGERPVPEVARDVLRDVGWS